MKFGGPYSMVVFTMRGSRRGLVVLGSTVLKKLELESRKLESHGVEMCFDRATKNRKIERNIISTSKANRFLNTLEGLNILLVRARLPISIFGYISTRKIVSEHLLLT